MKSNPSISADAAEVPGGYHASVRTGRNDRIYPSCDSCNIAPFGIQLSKGGEDDERFY